VFWPLALFVAVEIFARTEWPAGRRWVLLRFAGLLPVAGVAAVVSYRHLSGLLAFYNDDRLTVLIGPLAVDGLMVMATGALIATSRRRRPVDREPVAGHVATDTAPAAVTAATPAAIERPSEPVAMDGHVAIERPSEPVAMDGHVAIEPAKLRPPVRPPVATDTAKLVAKLVAKDPAIDAATVAKRLSVSERTARRHLAATRPATPVNGHVPDLTEVTP
jgi:hypothetical protein